jgi:predicted GNAT family N-acyltransferase
MPEIELKNTLFEHDDYADYLKLSFDLIHTEWEKDSDDCNENTIGSAHVLIFDESWSNVMSSADENSEETFELVSAITFNSKERNKKPLIHGRLAIITHLTINSENRGLGYGSASMKKLLSFLYKVMNVNYVLLQAHPYLTDLPHTQENLNSAEKKENKIFTIKAKQRLTSFYQAHHFKKIGLPSKNFMLLNL